MALVLADRVRETTTTAGTGTITLLGAVPSCQSFAVVGDGNTTYYTIVAQSGTAWEVGIGTYTAAGTTLSRDTVLSSSNSGSLVNFSTGTKDVFVDYPASKAVYENAAGNVDGYPITGGTINNTVIGGTTPAAGTFTTLTATGQTSLGGVAGSESIRATVPSTTGNYWQFSGSSADIRLDYLGSGTNIGASFVTRGTGNHNFATGTSATNIQARISHTASAVNYVQVTGAATGSSSVISAQGSDTNSGLIFRSKGSSSVTFQSGGGATQLLVSPTGGGQNYWRITGSSTGLAIPITAEGSDTNVAMALRTQGTGAIDLAAGSSGVNISNGGTVTAVTRTAAGTSYTSSPTVAISAPTTAGGVQATATVTISTTGTPTIVSGGTGYTVNDVLTIVGGTPISVAATMTVTAVSGGVITAASYTNFAQYTVAPTGTISVTGGTGSGATFNISFGVTTAFTITNAGSGYVEQPTVSFSGGGGSGAAAYATVGSVTTIKSLGSSTTGSTLSSIQFVTPNNSSPNYPPLTIRDIANSDTGILISPNTGYTQLIANNASSGILMLGSFGTSSVYFNTNGTNQTNQMRVSHTASAVNYVQVTGNITSNSPQISFTGSDAGVGGALITKGNGAISFFNNGTTTSRQFRIGAGVVTTAVNYINADGSATGNATQFQTYGTDTNIAMALRTQGTGAIDLAAGSSGVNISNGGSVTAITRTVQGSLYTSVPSLAISAPTTAGGVQATATANLGVLAATIVSGGTGYTAGDTLTVVGGTGTSAQLTVSTVSSGVITAVTVAAQNGVYSVFPTSPVSVTGGTGSSATFNISGGILSTFTITNAGTGYVEQPTVTFSGGGGSGAAAYATVGGDTAVKTLGTNLTFSTPAGPVLALADSTSGGAYIQLSNSSTGNTFARATGSATNIGFYWLSKGTGGHAFTTNNNSGTVQFNVTHTASAVNYVQVTGAATTGAPIISAQGSDTNIGLVVQSKGTSPLYLQTVGSTDVRIQPNNLRSFSVSSVASAVNYGVWTNSAAGFAPSLAVAGSDTNIDLTLTPKGTGVVQFGSYTASPLLAVAGYITIKDSGGTTRRLLVG